MQGTIVPLKVQQTLRLTLIFCILEGRLPIYASNLVCWVNLVYFLMTVSVTRGSFLESFRPVI